MHKTFQLKHVSNLIASQSSCLSRHIDITDQFNQRWVALFHATAAATSSALGTGPGASLRAMRAHRVLSD
jgi:hypothetical protein